ncbi:MAG: GTPase Era [Acidimicrobiaceae bacterium]|nr:GTPase Era [Acidimicrobiaceae bacterium]
MTRSGFCALVGRPNVGKSTLVNQIIGTKVTITASTPHTTRGLVRGILTEGETQVVFVDTPGLHRPASRLGFRLNESARAGIDGVDVICVLIDASAEIGTGDRTALILGLESARPRGPRLLVVVNKMDRTGGEGVALQLLEVQKVVETIARERGLESALHALEYFPVSARTGRGVPELVAFVTDLMPEGPWFFPEDEVSDVPEAVWVAELVREQLVRKTRQEIPHSIHCRVSEFEWPHITVEVVVERESQKGMVIGKGGQLLKEVGIAARRQLPEGCYLELRVVVEEDWQRRDDAMDRFGL